MKKEEKSLINQKYSTISTHMKENLSSLILDKQNATLALALSVSRIDNIKTTLLIKNHSLINLKSLSLELKEKTRFRNVWFQLINKKGISLYRSWTNNKNDSLLFREDIKDILKNKKIKNSISVGKYDMNFKSMIPIFDDNNLIGVFEIITHFNSISNTLKEKKIDSVVLADKIYKDKLIYPFTKKFIKDYYIANLNAKDYLINILEKNDLENLLKIEDYKLVQNNILTTYTIIKHNNKNIGYIVLAKNIKDIDTNNIRIFKQTANIYLILFIVLIGFLFTMASYYLHANNISKLNKKLKKNLIKVELEKHKNQIILNSQKNIIVVTDGIQLQNANLQLLVFFDTYLSIEEYKKDYNCICETFIEMNNDEYVIEKDYNGKNWAQFILSNPDKQFKAAIKKANKIHHFTLNVNLSQFKDEEQPYILVTLTDITHEIQQKEKLKSLNDNLELIVDFKTKELKQLNDLLEKKVSLEIKKNHEKDRILFQKNKMAAMGEMLENIAHQWRQPLSSISTAASSIQIQKELNILDDKKLNQLCDFILKNSQYLSNTIEDFKNFFKKDKVKQEVLIKDAINENINLLKDKLKHDDISLVINIPNDIFIYGYRNEFQQAILNIINNSIDAFTINKIKNKKLLFITCTKNQLSIKDTANGIDDKIIDKIFEPYFTTKHQTQGTGIGLYMTEEILTKHMNFHIEIKNSNFTYEGENYKGLNFIITFKQLAYS